MKAGTSTLLAIVAILLLLGGTAIDVRAFDLTGTWEGTIKCKGLDNGYPMA